MKLENCPFCGSDSVVVNSKCLLKDNRVSFAYCIVCQNCQMTYIPFDVSSEEEAIEDWNKRKVFIGE